MEQQVAVTLQKIIGAIVTVGVNNLEIHDLRLVSIRNLHFSAIERHLLVVVLEPILLVNLQPICAEHDGVLPRLHVFERVLRCILRWFQPEFLSRLHVFWDGLSDGIGSVIPAGQVRYCPILKDATNEQNPCGHGPLSSFARHSQFDALSDGKRNRSEQHRKEPVHHQLTEQVNQHQTARQQNHARLLVVQRDAICEGTDDHRDGQNRQHHILHEALPWGQRNGISETPTSKHALVWNFHKRSCRIFNQLESKGITR